MATDPGGHVMREKRLTYEWLKKYHGNSPQWIQVRLGPIANGNPMYSGIRRYADVVYLESNTIHIVEASVIPTHEKIAQLELYRNIFPDTPEFSSFSLLPIQLDYLTTLDDKYTRQLAEAKGISYIVYTPTWIKEYLKQRLS